MKKKILLLGFSSALLSPLASANNQFQVFTHFDAEIYTEAQPVQAFVDDFDIREYLDRFDADTSLAETHQELQKDVAVIPSDYLFESTSADLRISISTRQDVLNYQEERIQVAAPSMRRHIHLTSIDDILGAEDEILIFEGMSVGDFVVTADGGFSTVLRKRVLAERIEKEDKELLGIDTE